MSEAYWKSQQSFCGHTDRQNQGCCLPEPQQPQFWFFLSLLPHIFPLTRVLSSNFCHFLLPLFFPWAFLLLTGSPNPDSRARKTNSPSGDGALCPACLSGWLTVRSGCLLRGGWGIITFLVPLEIRVARFTWGAFSSHIISICVKIKMQLVLFLQISMQILSARADQGNQVH